MNRSKILLIILMILGLTWRLVPLTQNYSFWTDEDHVAIFSKAILEKGSPILANEFNIGIYQLPMYWLGALGMKVFGQREIAIRWPSLIFGVLSILAVYLLSKKLFSKQVGLLAAFLTAFLNIEILWSIQGRPYQAIQFFWLLGAYFSFQYLQEKKIKYLFWGAICGLAAEFFHPIGAIFFLFQLTFYLLILRLKPKVNQIKFGIVIFFLIILQTPIVAFSVSTIQKLGTFNNFYYYRIFLSHNYLSLIIFSLTGFILMINSKKYWQFLFLSIPLAVQFFIVSFVADVPFTRYFYPVFGFLIILASYGILETGEWIQKILNIKYKIFKILNIKYSIFNILYSIFSFQYSVSVLLVLLMVFSLWKTDKLSLFPRKVYSLNSDMQEIPEVDWKKLYFFVEKRLESNPNAILVTNWMDTPVWFLGEGKLNYLLRKSKLEIDSLSGARYINSLDKFLSLTKEKPEGILVLDSWDMAVPEKVREFCQENLKKEMGINRLYSTQPRYWPVNVYSWGIK